MMKIGINGTGLVQKASVTAIIDHARQAKADGFASYWLAEHPTGGLDAMMVLAMVGLQVPDMELGTAIVPTFPRHPMVLAGQVHTTLAAIGPRFTLGIGLSHATMMAQLGIAFDKPIRHLREYLSVLVPLLNEGRVNFTGELISCAAQTFFTPAAPCPVVVAALGPQALKVAGQLADGTTLAWVGPRTAWARSWSGGGGRWGGWWAQASVQRAWGWPRGTVMRCREACRAGRTESRMRATPPRPEPPHDRSEPA